MSLVKTPIPIKIKKFNKDFIIEGNPPIKNMGEYRSILTRYVTGLKLTDAKPEWFNDYKKKLLTLTRPSDSELIKPPKQKTTPSDEDIKISKVQINLPFSGTLDMEKLKNQAIKNMDITLDNYVKGLVSKLPKQLNNEGRNKIFEDNIIGIKNLGDEVLAELTTELWPVWIDKVKNVERLQIMLEEVSGKLGYFKISQKTQKSVRLIQLMYFLELMVN